MGNAQRRDQKESATSSNSSSRSTSASIYEPEGNLLYKPQLDSSYTSKWQTQFSEIMLLIKDRLRLSERELYKMTRVCKSWRYEIYRPIRRFDFNSLCQKGNLTDEVLAGIAHGIGPNLRKIDITEVEELFYNNQNALYQSHTGIAAIADYCNLLEDLTIPIPLNADVDSFPDMTDPLVKLMATAKLLKRLNLSNHKFGEPVYAKMSALSYLVQLTLSGGPNLAGLGSLHSASIISLSIGASDYQFLDRKYVEATHKGINDELLKKLSANLPNLQTLEVYGAMNVTDNAIKEMTQNGLKNLITIKLTGYEHEKDETARDPSQARLAPGVTSKSLEFLSQCKRLQSVSILHMNEVGKDDLTAIERLLTSCSGITTLGFSKVNAVVTEKVQKKFSKVKIVIKS